MELMVKSKWVSSITADKAEVQYSGLVRNANFISEMKGFKTCKLTEWMNYVVNY